VWLFVDFYGPDDISSAPGMQVPPHPHTGLQTVSWLVSGEVLHRDSVGSYQLVTPG
jgi:quercetin 2,3-dioxygenase